MGISVADIGRRRRWFRENIPVRPRWSPPQKPVPWSWRPVTDTPQDVGGEAGLALHGKPRGLRQGGPRTSGGPEGEPPENGSPPSFWGGRACGAHMSGQDAWRTGAAMLNAGTGDCATKSSRGRGSEVGVCRGESSRENAKRGAGRRHLYLIH